MRIVKRSNGRLDYVGEKLAPVSLPIAKGEQLGPEVLDWFWHPNRGSVAFAPDDFRRKLHEMDPDLEITWHPIRERWLVWMRRPTFQTPICWGWLLLFPVQNEDKSHRPLDERVFARLYGASAHKWGSAREYFRAVEREIEHDRERAARQRRQDRIDELMPFFDFSQLKVSMRGHSNGSKFSTFHS
jgi:hypothetical protein